MRTTEEILAEAREALAHHEKEAARLRAMIAAAEGAPAKVSTSSAPSEASAAHAMSATPVMACVWPKVCFCPSCVFLAMLRFWPSPLGLPKPTPSFAPLVPGLPSDPTLPPWYVPSPLPFDPGSPVYPTPTFPIGPIDVTPRIIMGIVGGDAPGTPDWPTSTASRWGGEPSMIQLVLDGPLKVELNACGPSFASSSSLH